MTKDGLTEAGTLEEEEELRDARRDTPTHTEADNMISIVSGSKARHDCRALHVIIASCLSHDTNKG